MKQRLVAGIDEAGRGPLAGPVVAAAVVILPKPNLGSFSKLKDSKQLSQKQRKEWYHIFHQSSDIQWGIGRVGEQTIDKINIYQATKLAMERAVANLENKLHTQKPSIQSYDGRLRIIDFLLVDGTMRISSIIPQKTIVKGDEKIALCAMASIVAKVTRDRLMVRYHKLYPSYGFDRHKGYGTKFHQEMLKIHGPCKIHRKTFFPVSQMTNF